MGRVSEAGCWAAVGLLTLFYWGLQKKDTTTIDELHFHFHKPLAEVAKELSVCMTLIKRVCRQHGIMRWPHRKVAPPPEDQPAPSLTARGLPDQGPP